MRARTGLVNPAGMSNPTAPTAPIEVVGQSRRLFLLERFWPGVTPHHAEEASRGLGRVAAEQDGLNAAVLLLSGLLLDDEVVFSLVEAGSASAAWELSDRAAFQVDRISESSLVGPIGTEPCA